MPSVLVKRSSVAGRVPAVGDLALGEIAVNTNDGKLYIKKDNGTASVVEIGASAAGVTSFNTRTGTVTLSSGDVTTALGFTPYNATNPSGYITSSALTPYLTTSTAATTYQPLDGDLTAIAGLAGTTGFLKKTAANTWSLDTSTYLTGITSGQVTTALGFTPYNATNPSGYTSNTGTVTSVGGTGTVSGLSLSGTVTTTGNLTLGGTLSVTASNFASQTANTVLVAPNGAAGVPTFRALAAADIPTLNQNTTGTASNVTGTVAIANGGTGSTTAAGALTALGAYAASNPSAYITTAGARSALSFTAGSGAYNGTTGVITIPTNTNQLTNGAGFTSNAGTVTSVTAGTGLSGGTITASGTISLADGGVTAAKLSGAQSGSAPIYGARAWVSFNGTNAVAIRASGNVSSIFDNGLGDYTVNFLTAMADANYAPVITSGTAGANNVSTEIHTISSSSCRLRTTRESNGATTMIDNPIVSFAVFR